MKIEAFIGLHFVGDTECCSFEILKVNKQAMGSADCSQCRTNVRCCIVSGEGGVVGRRRRVVAVSSSCRVVSRRVVSAQLVARSLQNTFDRFRREVSTDLEQKFIRKERERLSIYPSLPRTFDTAIKARYSTCVDRTVLGSSQCFLYCESVIHHVPLQKGGPSELCDARRWC